MFLGVWGEGVNRSLAPFSVHLLARGTSFTCCVDGQCTTSIDKRSEIES